MIRPLTIAHMPEATSLALKAGPVAAYNLSGHKWLEVLWEHSKEGRALVDVDPKGVNGVAVYALVQNGRVAHEDGYRLDDSGPVVWCPFATSTKPGILNKMIAYVKRQHPTVRELAYCRTAKGGRLVTRRLCHGR